MNELLLEYLPVVIFIGVALVICVVMMAAPFIVAVSNPDPEKVSAYECGFETATIKGKCIRVLFGKVGTGFPVRST